MLEFQRARANREHYDALLNIFPEHGGAYGYGIEYAYTMVDKTPQAAKKPHLIKKWCIRVVLGSDALCLGAPPVQGK